VYWMEYKEDVKTGNNAGHDISNIAGENVDYHDIASISLTIKGTVSQTV